MNTTGKYLYGIVEEPREKSFEFHGLEDAIVYTITYRDLSALVSDTGMEEIDPTRKNVLAHTLVQENILKRYTVVPMGFGIVASSESNVRALLENNYQSLLNEIKKLSGKIEVELKAFWDDDAMKAENERLISRTRERVKTAASAVEVQRLLTEAGMQVEKIALEWKARYVDQIYSSLKKMAVDSRLNKCSGVKVLMNAAFLIEKKTEDDFVEQVHSLDAKYKGKINFKYIGPLSPYSFVNIKLGLVN
ncbi:MAG: GvpL/GvpF family gas vesicle protein [Dehalococcoidales bacterium]|nr:GvpL/GvpF family gas vesicle protein [Dehalococcoidales bacterium]